MDIRVGDCRELLREIPSGSVRCCVTSPPYWGLRDYGTATWEGGDSECSHIERRQPQSLAALADRMAPRVNPRNPNRQDDDQINAQQYRNICGKCGARRVDSQLGLEKTPGEYVARMVEVFREVKRILTDDGTLFLNIGDSYASSAMDVQRVRTDRGQARTCEGQVPQVLSPLRKEGVVGDTQRSGKGEVAGVVSGECNGAECADGHAAQDSPVTGGGGTGREVPVLRRDGASVLDAGSRSERWPQRPETGEAPPDGASGGGRLPTGSLPDPLLELQRGESDGGLSPYGRLKPKDLVGIPWMLAFALRADGWYLRSDIIWAKPNPMPESVTDRPTKAHEYLFLLAKSQRYYYDAAAIAEPGLTLRERIRPNGIGNDENKAAPLGFDNSCGADGTRNRRTVWTIPTQPFAEAHFAVMPEALVEPCILAGSAPGDTVLDPFAGSGTVGVVALRYGRRFLGCELNAEYVTMARRRVAGPLFSGGDE